MVNGLAYVIVVATGAAVGSFLNVLILRTYQGQPWWRNRSHCPHCGTTLHWFELIPIVSYVALGGRCRSCHRVLTRQYLIVEVLTAISFVAIFQAGGLTALTIVGWFVVSCMIAAGVYDARWSLLPDEFSIGLAIGGAALAILYHRPWNEIIIGGLAGAGFFAIQYFASRRRWVGSGDILLGSALGLLLGWRLLAACFFLAYLTGAVVAVALLLNRRLRASQTMPFGPYLLAAGLVSWLWGDRIIDWYFRHALFR